MSLDVALIVRHWLCLRVQIYKNLTLGCWSVRHRGIVIEHRDEVWLENCSFVVQPGGRQRCLRSGVRNVHAYVSGIQVRPQNCTGGSQIRYNPFRSGSFVDQAGETIRTSRYCHLGQIATAYEPGAGELVME